MRTGNVATACVIAVLVVLIGRDLVALRRAAPRPPVEAVVEETVAEETAEAASEALAETAPEAAPEAARNGAQEVSPDPDPDRAPEPPPAAFAEEPLVTAVVPDGADSAVAITCHGSFSAARTDVAAWTAGQAPQAESIAETGGHVTWIP